MSTSAGDGADHSGDEPGSGAGGGAYLLVRAGHRNVALPLEAAREVVRAGRTVRVPGARPPVEGLLGVRGEVVAVVDLLSALDASSTADDRGPVLVLQSGDAGSGGGGGRPGSLGLRVTDVEDILEPKNGPSPAVAPYLEGPWSGVVPWRDGVAGVLDVAALQETLMAAQGGAEVSIV